MLSERPGKGLGQAVMAMPLWLNFKLAVFRDVDIIAVGQEPYPLVPFSLAIGLGNCRPC